MIVSHRERSTSLVVSEPEQGFSTIVSVGERGLVLGASGRAHDFSFDVPWRGHRRLSRVTSAMGTFTRLWLYTFHIVIRFSQQFVVQMFGCLNHVQVRLPNDIAGMQTIDQCILALVKMSEPLRQFADDILFRTGYSSISDSCFLRACSQGFLVEVASNTPSWSQTWKRVVNIQFSVEATVYLVGFCRLFGVFPTFSGTRVLPKIQLKRV